MSGGLDRTRTNHEQDLVTLRTIAFKTMMQELWNLFWGNFYEAREGIKPGKVNEWDAVADAAIKMRKKSQEHL